MSGDAPEPEWWLAFLIADIGAIADSVTDDVINATVLRERLIIARDHLTEWIGEINTIPL
jgi:hypothetical protein